MTFKLGRSRLRSVCQGLLLVLATLFSVAGFAQDSVYGQTEFENSGEPQAQSAFTEGLLMLHSFQYEDARESFLQAQKLDPDFAMAYWGEAMTYNYPLWPTPPDREAAQAALAKLGKTPAAQRAKAPTKREKDYIAAVQTLFGEGDKKERDFKYLAAMEGMAKKYPDDLDAALFLALAHLGTSHEGRDFSIYMKAAAIAEEVSAKNPLHPGAAHYMIHSYDDPIHAPLGLRAAKVYANIAPSASHAQHMPSHIFFALGMWEEATHSNAVAYESDKTRASQKDQELSSHGYHAIWWLLYSKLQQGQYTAAKAVIDDVEGHYQSSDIKGLAGSVAISMNTLYAVETRQWNHKINRIGIKQDNFPTRPQSAYLFVQGVNALENNELPNARNFLKRLTEGTKNETDPGSEVLRLELTALVQVAEGDSEAALESITQANRIEENMPMDFGPPWPTKPSHELHGEILLELGRADEAIAQFNQALARSPKRALSLLGLARAAALADKPQLSLGAYRDLNAIWADAEPSTPALAEVREAVGDS